MLKILKYLRKREWLFVCRWVGQRQLTIARVGRISFVIAHRLSTIRNADMILVMKDGGQFESVA